MSKKTKQFEDLVADLTDLKDWEFKEAIAIAKQFRRAQKRLGKAMDRQERERIIRGLIDQLGNPCAPLLIGYLWKNKSMETLAQELAYSNADSAKSQKAKCMKKVKTFVKQQLIEYGYGY